MRSLRTFDVPDEKTGSFFVPRPGGNTGLRKLQRRNSPAPAQLPDNGGRPQRTIRAGLFQIILFFHRLGIL